MTPAFNPWCRACSPSVAETCALADQLEVDRQGADLEEGREILGFLDAR